MDVRRIALIVGGLAAAVVLFLILRPGSEDDRDAAPATTEQPVVSVSVGEPTPPTPPPPPAPDTPVFRITIAGGSIKGGLREFDVERDQKVTLVVSSDVADHVHVHGIDVLADVGPGKPATLTFTPTVAGRYEIELENAGLQIAQLNVTQ